VRVAPRAFASAPWRREARRSAIPRPGRGRCRAGSSDNAALMSWSDKRAAGDLGPSARQPRLECNQRARCRWPMPPSPRLHRHIMSRYRDAPARPHLRPSSISLSGLGATSIGGPTGPFSAASSLRASRAVRSTSRAALRSQLQLQGATPLRLISNIDSQTGSLGQSLLQLRYVS
jgi:hypothetical protein